MSSDKKYDSAWKNVIENLFAEFLLFFFPETYTDIDFSKGYEFLNKEFQKIVKESDTGIRYTDELVKVFLKDGSEQWLLIHIEVQSYKEQNFEERIYVYNYRIFDRYKKEVISLVILTDSDKNYRPNQYKVKRWNFKNVLEFPLVKLIDYAERKDELISSKNPFAVVVLAHLNYLETQKIRDENNMLENKINLIKELFKRGFSKEIIEHLFVFIDWLFQLSEIAELKFQERVKVIEGGITMSYITTWERRGIEKAKIEDAKRMYNKGFSIEDILDITGLSIDQLKTAGFFDERNSQE